MRRTIASLIVWSVLWPCLFVVLADTKHYVYTDGTNFYTETGARTNLGPAVSAFATNPPADGNWYAWSNAVPTQFTPGGGTFTGYVDRIEYTGSEPAAWDLGGGSQTGMIATLTLNNSWHVQSLSAKVPTNATAVNLAIWISDNARGTVFLVGNSSVTNIYCCRRLYTQVHAISFGGSLIVGLGTNSTISYYGQSGLDTVGISIMGWIP